MQALVHWYSENMSMQAEAVDQKPVGIKEEPIEIDFKVKEEWDDEFLEVLPSSSKCIFDEDKDVLRASLKIEPEHDIKILPSTSKIDPEDDLFEEDRLKNEKSEFKEEIMSEDEDDESDSEPEGLSDNVGEGPSTIKTEELMIKSESGDSDTREDYQTGKKCITDLETNTIIGNEIDNSEVYSCPQCSFDSDNDAYIRKHFLTTHTDQACDLCDSQTNVKAKHNRRMHDGVTGTLVCKLCEYKTDYELRLQDDLLAKHVNHDIERYTCDICEFKTDNLSTLNGHKAASHPIDIEDKYVCGLCHYKTCHKRYLNAHKLRMHQQGGSKQFTCHLCDYKTHYKNALERHKENVHLKATSDTEKGTITQQCFQCPYKTCNKSSLERHVLVVHCKDTPGTHVCELCDYNTSLKHRLTLHMMMNHDFMMKHSCNIYTCHMCDYQTHQKLILKEHIFRNHDMNPIKEYKCNWCDYKLAIKMRHKLCHEK